MYSVMTYNIKNDSPTPDKMDLWEYRFPKMKKLIRKNLADIIGLQEVTKHQLDDLKKIFPSHYQFYGKRRSKDIHAEYNPLVINMERYVVIKSDTFWLSSTPNVIRKAEEWEADCYRIATWAIVKCKKNKKDILVVNTHFDHISEKARYESAKLLVEFIQNQQIKNIILMGDLNAGKDEKFYRVLSDELIDSVLSSEYHIGPFKTCTGVDFKHHIVWDEMTEIDYIFVSKSVVVYETNILTDRIEGRYPSDHFPVRCVFDLD